MYTFASDLDQTLIFSTNLNEKISDFFDLKKLVSVELINDIESSFMTNESLILLEEISHKLNFVPTTTRTIEQFKRINFGNKNIKFKYSITSNGGNILIHGEPQKQWHEMIKNNINKNCISFSAVNKKINEVNKKYDFLIKSKEADDLFCYFIINKDLLPGHELQSLREYFYMHNYNLSLQGRKLYVVPKYVDKAIAVKEVISMINSNLTGGTSNKIISAGDSLLDLSMLKISHIGFVPSHGEIIKNMLPDNKLPENISATESLYYLACEELLKKINILCK
jgi:hydroxymethylpyrimidine pyrophosphatase-like HAD family hydrolase